MSKQLGGLIMGMLLIVIGLVLSTTVLDQAATSGVDARIGSFSGAQSINDLAPLIWYVAIVMIGVGLVGVSGAGLAGFGPVKRG